MRWNESIPSSHLRHALPQKAVHDAVYGLMRVIDGVTGPLTNGELKWTFCGCAAADRASGETRAQIDLREGDGMGHGLSRLDRRRLR